jgi:hypothetical protein
VDRKFCDYFLVPFGKTNKKGKYLTSAAIIIDAHTGHFKEASWTAVPEQLLPVDKNKALVLIQKYLLQQMRACRVHLKLDPASSALRGHLENLYYDYLDCLVYGPRATGQLLWSAGEYSSSAYKPYWQISVNWNNWLVTQDGKVLRR